MVQWILPAQDAGLSLFFLSSFTSMLHHPALLNTHDFSFLCIYTLTLLLVILSNKSRVVPEFQMMSFDYIDVLL